jgi:hypothetical protein
MPALTFPRATIFISYSHDSQEHMDRVLELANRLRSEGVDCRLDQYEQAPPEGWPQWTEKQINDASFILLICTETYCRRVMGGDQPNVGQGVRWEGRIIYQHLYNSDVNRKFIPVLFSSQDAIYIPIPIQGAQRYPLDTPQGYESLYRRLTDQPSTLMPKLGKRRSLPVKERQTNFPEVSLRTTAIKGLLPFRHEDAELFASLQRERDIDLCLSAIKDSEFCFGVLSGESGCGKSSFLQAGLWPRLELSPINHEAIYVKFSNEDPLESLRRAIIDRFHVVEESDFVQLLEVIPNKQPHPTIILIDQFEQFFVHQKRSQEREPLIRAFTAWYRNSPKLPVKILVCIRGDFSDRLIEFQSSMGYALGPRQCFRLEKFEAKEASQIIGVMAGQEGLTCDETFIEAMCAEKLANPDDGLVSPVDIQILAWMIKGQRTSEERAFTRKAYQKLGGVEGLLERFLSHVLKARESEARRQAAVKILLALINLERNTRAGLMSLEQIESKQAGTLRSSEVEEAVNWLSREDIRLVFSSKRDDETVGYELAHERLIPAIRRLAGRQLSHVDQANRLLDQRVNEWLGNDRNRRYLLRRREWRLIEKQRPYLVWGPQQTFKEELLARSKKRSRRRLIIWTIILLPFIVPVFLPFFDPHQFPVTYLPYSAEHAEALFPSLPDKELDKELIVGLAASGGGSRAAIFAANALEALTEIPVRLGTENRSMMETVHYMSSVSGGSLATAYYVTKKPSKSEPMLVDNMLSPHYREFFWLFKVRMETNFQRRALNRQLAYFRALDPTKLAYSLSEVWDEEFLGRMTFAQLHEREQRGDIPRVILNGTVYNSGRRFVFTTLPASDFDYDFIELLMKELKKPDRPVPVTAEGMTVIEKGLERASRQFLPLTFERIGADYRDLPLSLAVATSASFPPVVGPVTYQVVGSPTYLHIGSGELFDSLGMESLLSLFLKKIPRGSNKRGLIIVLDSSHSNAGASELDTNMRGFQVFRDDPSQIVALMEDRANAYQTLLWDSLRTEGVLPASNQLRIVVLKHVDAEWTGFQDLPEVCHNEFPPDVTPTQIKQWVSDIPTLFKIRTPCQGALLAKAARKVVAANRDHIVQFIEGNIH